MLTIKFVIWDNFTTGGFKEKKHRWHEQNNILSAFPLLIQPYLLN